jgi:hypothetical protein
LGAVVYCTFEVHGSNRQGDEGEEHSRIGRHLQVTERERDRERVREKKR